MCDSVRTASEVTIFSFSDKDLRVSASAEFESPFERECVTVDLSFLPEPDVLEASSSAIRFNT